MREKLVCMLSSQIKSLNIDSPSFWNDLDHHCQVSQESFDDIELKVKRIVQDVRDRGDSAILDYTYRFDAYNVDAFDEFKLDPLSLKQAYDNLSTELKNALDTAYANIMEFHLKQKQSSWQYSKDGVLLGQQVTPLDSVGVYVPGGKASYPSSVLMNVIPAKVAGVERVVMVVPAPRGELNTLVLAAAYVAKVDEVYTIGGAQAIAALAHGTESIAPVCKIVGPGNKYVACAKKQVFGKVGIDMIAGPSEIMVVSDGTTEADWVAMDLFSQAEHDEDAQSILVSLNDEHLNNVSQSIDHLLEAQPRKDIIRTSLKEKGLFIKVNTKEQALTIINKLAPEHLELSVLNPRDWLLGVRNAGAVFLGAYTCESLGDYCAGPNHVLPTSATARFASPLGVYDFQKKTSIIEASKEGANVLGKVANTLALAESLNAHAQSAQYRVDDL